MRGRFELCLKTGRLTVTAAHLDHLALVIDEKNIRLVVCAYAKIGAP